MRPLQILLHLCLIVSMAAQDSPPAPPPDSSPAPALAPGSGSAPAPSGTTPAPAPAPTADPLASPPSPAPPPNDDGLIPNAPSPDEGQPAGEDTTVTWCAVMEEYGDCETYTSLLNTVTSTLNWTCVQKKDKGECMNAIKNGEADLISLEAGYAYIAFKNKTMKAILSEEYSFHAQTYGAVAVVNRRMCDRNSRLDLQDFRNLKSCHPGYQTAGGWNYPVKSLFDLDVDPRLKNTTDEAMDVKVINSFFSASCAPSELGYGGLCSACGNASSCSSIDSIYTGESGAFRCLMDGTGDIAFLRARTPQLYSSDGLNSQKWSTKPVADFMYLCPAGGCKEINDNYGDCMLGRVTANPVMTRNNVTTRRKDAIVKALLNANWTSTLYSGRNWQNHLLSVSTQSLAEVKQLTRPFLSISGEISQMIQDLNNNRLDYSGSPSTSCTPFVYVSLALGALISGILCVCLDFL